MKETTLPLSTVKLKSGKKRTKRKKRPRQNEVIESEENIPKKKIKKIKIRLADPQVPDSYICEVFDSSLEQDEQMEPNGKQEKGFHDDSSRTLEKLKPKDYFDILMSNESRRNVTINTSVLNEEIPQETKLFKDFRNEDILRRKISKQKTQEKLAGMVEKKRFSSYYSDSSDDESLFEVHSKIRRHVTKSYIRNCSSIVSDLSKNKENSSSIISNNTDDVCNMKNSAKNKNSNILKYFSKKASKDTAGVKPGKITKIDKFESSNGNHCHVTEKKVVGEECEKRTLKLAPVFEKKAKKTIDPNVLKARMEFLHNGLPTAMKKTYDNQKYSEDKYSGLMFPTIAHVQQKDDDPLWTEIKPCIPLLKAEEAHYKHENSGVFRFTISTETLHSGDNDTKHVPKNDLNSLQIRYKDINIEEIYNAMKEKKDYYLQHIDDLSSNVKTENTDDSANIFEVTNDGEGYNSLWTEIYKPKSYEIIGNKSATIQLSRWLKLWKEYDQQISSLTKEVKDITSNSDDDDFFESDERRMPRNICLLSGPVASGKTSLVYALASELDYNVLEVNASSKRTGKKLLLDLQEATKSHQVRSGLELKQKMVTGERGRNKKFNQKKKKKRKGSISTNSTNSKISLILIEDADIFFEEHDEGFVSAINTLVQSSKRPFIFLSNDPSYSYLERLKLQQSFMLKMERPNFLSACALLDIISVLEGINIEREYLENLVQKNNYDLRRSILELQFWIQSGRNLVRQMPFELGKLWWGFSRFLYKSDSIHHLKLNYRKRKRLSESYGSSADELEQPPKVVEWNTWDTKSRKKKRDSLIHAYSKILDSVSVCDLFKLDDDREPIPWIKYKPKDSLSLSESMESVVWKERNISEVISQELLMVSANYFARCCSDERDSKYRLSCPSWEEIRWRTMQQKAKNDLMCFIPQHIGSAQRILHLDYFPLLRNMCRTEKSRYFGNTKRKNRFFHYFQSLGLNLRGETLDINCDVFDY